MVDIYINDFVHLILHLVEHREGEGKLGLIFVVTVRSTDGTACSSRVALRVD